MSQPPSESADISDTETDPGYRSRSQSRRARRRKQPKNTPKKQSMPSVPENQQASAQASAQSNNESGSAESEAKSTALAQQALDDMSPEEQRDATAMQPFEWIGTDETSMNGPVTYAKAQRGEIAPRRGNPSQQLATGPGKGSGDGEKDPMDQDGLKLRIELNLDIEIELKAKIHGDLTLALL